MVHGQTSECWLHKSYQTNNYFSHLGLVGNSGGRLPMSEGGSLGLDISSSLIVVERCKFVPVLGIYFIFMGGYFCSRFSASMNMLFYTVLGRSELVWYSWSRGRGGGRSISVG